MRESTKNNRPSTLEGRLIERYRWRVPACLVLPAHLQVDTAFVLYSPNVFRARCVGYIIVGYPSGDDCKSCVPS